MNRIENIIRKMIFDKQKQDVLLETIIKKTLFTEQKTAMAKIARITKKEYEEARAAGAEHAFAVVTRGYSVNKLPEVIARLAERTEASPASGDIEQYDPEAEYKFTPDDGVTASDESSADAEENKPLSNEKRVSIGPNSKFATSETTVIMNPAYPEQSKQLEAAYRYLIGNIKQRGGKIRCIVWIIPMAENYGFLTYAANKDPDTFYALGLAGVDIGNADITFMRDFLAFSEKRAERSDIWREWYLKQKISELPLPPESWYKFAGRPAQAAVSISEFSTDTKRDEPDAKQDDKTTSTTTSDAAATSTTTSDAVATSTTTSEEVTDFDLPSGYKFSGTLGNFKIGRKDGYGPVSGKKTWPDPKAKGRIILFQGEFGIDETGKLKEKTGYVTRNSDVFELDGRQVYNLYDRYYIEDFKLVDDTDRSYGVDTREVSTDKLYRQFMGDLNQDLSFKTGNVFRTGPIHTLDGKQVYNKYDYKLVNGQIDETYNGAEIRKFAASGDKQIAGYKGTLDKNLKPITGQAYEIGNDGKRIPAGKFVNGKFE